MFFLICTVTFHDLEIIILSSINLIKSDNFGGETKPLSPDRVCLSNGQFSSKIREFIRRMKITRWWFQIFCIFTPTWERFPF